MVFTIFNNQRVADYELRENNNTLSTYIAVNKINLKKQDAFAANQVESTDNSQTLLFESTADLQASTYNTSILINNSGYAFYDSTHGLIYSGLIYDSYSDASVDTTKWTFTGGGTNTETANQFIQSTKSTTPGDTTLYIDSTGAAGINLKPGVTNSEFFLALYYNLSNSTSGNTYAKLHLRDNLANQVTLVTLYNQNTGSSGTGIYRIVLSSTNARIYTDRDSYTDVNISALAGNTWFIRYEGFSTGNNTSVTLKFYPLVYVNNSTVSAQTIESARTAVTPTVSTAFIHPDDIGDGLGTSTFQISANNGSNYTTVLADTWTAIANTGTTLSAKYTLQGTSMQKLIKIDSQCVLFSE